MSFDPLTISALVGLGKDLISRVWKDPSEQADQLRKLTEIEQKQDLAELQAYITVLQGRMSIINQEAKSDHWLTANWRPITMMVFLGLIVLRWLGFTNEDITDAEYLKAWELLQMGIGGYIASRGIEKVVSTYKKTN
jgi:uncharacterized membrane protein